MPFAIRGNVRIHYEAEGDGPPVLVATGAGTNLAMWRAAGWVDAIPSHRVILADPRGHGESDKPRTVEAHRVEEYAEDVLAALRAAGESRSVVFGISDGSEIAVALAQAHPDVVTAIIDLDGWDDRDLCDDPIRADRLEWAKAVRAAGWPAYLKHIWGGRLVADERPLVKEFMSADTEMVALGAESWTRWKGPMSILPRLKVPILRLVSGTRSQEELDRIQRLRQPNIETHVFPGVDHFDLCTEPVHSKVIVNQFLERVRRPAT